MTKEIPKDFSKIFSQLWELPTGMNFNSVTKSPIFTDLCDYSNTHCYARIKGVFDQVPFARGLQRLGVPCFFESGSILANSDIDQAAEQCYIALMQQSVKRIYLCPLDCAGDIPCMTFGNAEIKIYSPAELGALLNTATARRQPGYKYSDTQKLAEFTWLVIESDVEMAPEFQQRYSPQLSIDISEFGTLYPYRSRYPKDVESALFMLMLMPWENWLDEYDLNWRPFDIPWVHTIHDDIFECQRPILDASTLTWHPDFYVDHNDEEIEIEVPYARNNLATEDKLKIYLSNEFLSYLTRAINNGLINAAAQHQFIKAFMSSDIDAFLANIIVIDACMGSTHAEHQKITDKRYKKLGPTGCLKHRLIGLLEDKSVKDTMDTLYDYRSRYVHGDDIAEIEGKVTLQARTLTRRMLVAIITLTVQKPTLTRATFLYDTLEKGWMLANRQ